MNAFRALGTICCVLEGITELQECGGVELLARTLATSSNYNMNSSGSGAAQPTKTTTTSDNLVC